MSQREEEIQRIVDEDEYVVAARAEWERQQAADEYPPIPREELPGVLWSITQRAYRKSKAAELTCSRALYAFENDDLTDLNPRQRNVYLKGLKEEARARALARLEGIEDEARRIAFYALKND